MSTRRGRTKVEGRSIKISLTVGGLLHRESVELAKLYVDLGDWSSVKTKVTESGILQTRTVSAGARIFREISSRLMCLTRKEMYVLSEVGRQDQLYILWLAVCRNYPLIADFATEVLRERYIGLKGDLNYENFDAFFNQKAEWNEQLDQVSSRTRNKMRQVLFRILREADLLTDSNIIKSAMIAPSLVDLIHRSNPSEVLYFPIPESGSRGMKI